MCRLRLTIDSVLRVIFQIEGGGEGDGIGIFFSLIPQQQQSRGRNIRRDNFTRFYRAEIVYIVGAVDFELEVKNKRSSGIGWNCGDMPRRWGPGGVMRSLLPSAYIFFKT